MHVGKTIINKTSMSEIIKRMHICKAGHLYDVYIDGAKKGIMKCIQETRYLIVFQNPEYRYRWKKIVVDKRDVVGNIVWIREV